MTCKPLSRFSAFSAAESTMSVPEFGSAGEDPALSIRAAATPSSSSHKSRSTRINYDRVFTAHAYRHLDSLLEPEVLKRNTASLLQCNIIMSHAFHYSSGYMFSLLIQHNSRRLWVAKQRAIVVMKCVRIKPRHSFSLITWYSNLWRP